MPRRLGVTALLLMAGLGLAGCEGMKGLLALRNGLAETFRTPGVGVNLLTSGTLIVTLQNSPLDGQDGDGERETCRAVAEYVRDHFASYATLRTVQVVFARQRGIGGLSMTQSRTACSYSHAE